MYGAGVFPLLRPLCTAGLALVLLAAPARGADPGLTAEQRAALDQGEILVVASAGQGMASQAWARIDAEPTAIWDLVSDPEHLRASSGSIKELVVNGERTLADGRVEQRLGYVIQAGFTDIRYSVIRVYDRAANRMSWTLDPAFDSDIQATNGVFTLYPQPDGSTLFRYQIAVDSGRSVPEWIQQHLTTSGIKRFLRYVQDQT